MSSNVLKFNDTGTALMQFDVDVPLSVSYRVVSVTCHFNVTPVSAENFTVRLDAHAGTPYDTLLYTLDPGTTSTQDILWQPDEEILLEGLDQIEIRYDNTDARLYGCQVTMKVV